MPGSVRVQYLKHLAEQCSRAFTLQNLAESNFISTARYKGFNAELVYKIAAVFWPNGYGSLHLRDSHQ